MPMRYRIGEKPGELGPPATDDMAIGTAVFGLLTGIGFVVAGLRGRQSWLAVWGAGLAIASVAYLAAVALGHH
jgi:hypothetical protein